MSGMKTSKDVFESSVDLLMSEELGPPEGLESVQVINTVCRVTAVGLEDPLIMGEFRYLKRGDDATKLGITCRINDALVGYEEWLKKGFVTRVQFEIETPEITYSGPFTWSLSQFSIKKSIGVTCLVVLRLSDSAPVID